MSDSVHDAPLCFPSPSPAGHFPSIAQLCLAVFRKHGMKSAMSMLLEAARQLAPVERINAVFICRDGSSVLNIFDTKPNDRMVTYYLSPNHTAAIAAGKAVWKRKHAIRLEDIDRPTLINDLSPYKTPALLNNPLCRGIPFLSHQALLRLPLFVMEPFVFVANFWADVTNAFQPEHIDLLKELVGPLGKELGENLAVSGTTFYEAEKEMEEPRPFLDFYVKQLEKCPGMREVCGLIRKVARTDATVIIQGETGVGKEFVACAIHEQSSRKNGPFVTVNCGAIAPTLVESELFGHERGAFTGAVATRRGYFEQAQGGSIFLDEIGDLPLSAQVKLLRVLEKGHLVRVGGSRAMRLDVRIIAATNADLDAKMRRGTFRRDLWYRLAVFPLHIPPLRERTGDIPHLVRDFLCAKSRELNMDFKGTVSEREIRRLYDYDWPGNVRELEHVVERSLIMHGSDIGPLKFVLPEPSQKNAPPSSEPGTGRRQTDLPPVPEESSLWPTLKDIEECHIRRTLEKCGGKMLGQDGATTLLGIHYSTLRAKMKHMGLPLPSECRKKMFST